MLIWFGWFIVRVIYYLCRLAEKRAAIGYTYEDGIVPEPEPQSDKDEDNSENSESEEDEGIPDIGEQTPFCLDVVDLGRAPFHFNASAFICCPDVEVDVDELNQEQVLDVNKMATSYGMAEGDFVR